MTSIDRQDLEQVLEAHCDVTFLRRANAALTLIRGAS